MTNEGLRSAYNKRVTDYNGDWSDEYVSWLEHNLTKRINKELNIKRSKNKRKSQY